MNPKRFSLLKRLQSFRYAFHGLRILVREEHNARIHLVATLCVIAAGFCFRVSALEWIALLFAMGFVFVAETLNTALENLSDFVSPEKHESIRKIKDLSAAAVLISAFTALITGIIIFAPKIWDLCSKG
jgi:diacylglycerol kinase